MTSKILVIGSGGREHAITWKLSESPRVKEIYVCPGSFGIASLPKVKNIDLNLKDFEEIARWCLANNIGLVVVGPEDPLARGIADVLESFNIPTFGPRKNAARLETDKEWAKIFMDKHSIPTANWKSFTNPSEAKKFIKSAPFPALVIKASGLAGGKGVVIAKDVDEACNTVDEILTEKKFGNAGNTIVIEELLEGEEVSVLAFCDGNSIKAVLPAQDHKRIYENDLGPNTGGMGAYCPCLSLESHALDYIHREVLCKAVNGLNKENLKYVGILYAGLILTEDGPKVLEFNCRFGDPETEVILPLLESDLFEIMEACCKGKLESAEIKWKDKLTSVGIVLASRGYPNSSSRGDLITGIELVEKIPDCLVFHCGTSSTDRGYVTNGGRVLIVVSYGNDIVVAIKRVLAACKLIEFDGKQYRRDIAWKGVSRFILRCGTSTYEESGVNITAGNKFVENIKSLTKSTFRPGVVGGIGSFGGLFDLKLANYKNPILVSGTDGVGTKLLIAQEVNIHNTIGIDLVAMCVNDILAHGAEPLFFLDYFGCGKLQLEVGQKIVEGISEGCKQANCALIGGETAEMSGMYSENEYDLAGFSVGAVEKDKLLPVLEEIGDNDVVIGLSSSGIHSNGLSLVRKTLKASGHSFRDIAPFSDEKKSFGEEFLKPTKIYVKSVLPLIKQGKVKAFAHITGGGLLENIPRIIPKHLMVKIDASKWKILPVFGWLAAVGQINESELLRTFNCGLGGIIIADAKNVRNIVDTFSKDEAFIVGKVSLKSGDNLVEILNFSKCMASVMQPFLPSLMNNLLISKKRIGVLISGTGTNLQSLINAQNSGKLKNAEISLVISNKDEAEGLNKASKAAIATKVIRNKDYANRADFDRALHEELTSKNIDIVCLAGFMRILTAEFVKKWKGRLINIHPALLPLFKGTHAQKQAIDARVRLSGCTVHFVDENVDTGAIIAQKSVPVHLLDTVESLTDRIKEAEHNLYPEALQLLVNDKISLQEDSKIKWKI